MPVQVATIKCRPATIRAADPVRHDHVGVQQRVARPRGPVIEADRQQPVALDAFVAAMTASRADVLLQIAERLLGRLMVRLQYLRGDLRITQAV
jgi:hypothetical protein